MNNSKSPSLDLDSYIARKREAELRKGGYEEYAAVEIFHFSKHCPCLGMNPACRQTTHIEWRKPKTNLKAWGGKL